MAKKSKMGRPPLPKDKKRVWVGARITPQAFSVLQRKTKPGGPKLGDILSDILVNS